MSGFRALVVCGLALLLGLSCTDAGAGSSVSAESRRPAINEISVAELLAEARETLALIKNGGPYPYQRDGVIFGNYERVLPLHDRGYYLEYTVPTPGVRNRGVRRIVAGKNGEYYYTDDHYRSFRRIRE